MKDGRYARFPDAVTTRGKKHLKTLMEVKKLGMRAVMLYVVQRMDVEIFVPARDIDLEYSKTLVEAYNMGVEIIPVQASVSPESIIISHKMPYKLNI